MIPIYLDSHIKINKKFVDFEMRKELLEALSVSIELYGGDFKEFNFFNEDKVYYIFPRGFLTYLLKGLSSSGHKYKLIDKRVYNKSCTFNSKINLKKHQVPAVASILKEEQGIYQAPPGSGKTITSLEAVRLAATTSIILTDRVSIADQWRQRAESFLGCETGYIGDGSFDVKDFTVASKQTLWSRKDELRKTGFFDKFGFVIIDECHHSSADNYQLVIQEFKAKYRIGLSATPYMNSGYEKIIHLLLGEIIHVTKEDDLQSEDILVRPKVFVTKTNFYKKYFNTGKYNNYQQVIKALVNDYARNLDIASIIVNNGDKRVLVSTSRIAHIDNLKSILETLNYKNNIYILTGKESRQEKSHICSEVANSPCVLLSTIAQEALDIPSLDLLINSFPVNKKDLMRQKIGRVERSSPGKNVCEVYDFHDHRCGVLDNQFRNRISLYREKGLEIEFL